MNFEKYQHLERFGTSEVNGIENGMCYVFPKIDGTNASLWWDCGLQAGSRNRKLEIDNDNAGFFNWALKQDKFINFFIKYPNIRLFGEWLVPHTLRTYEDAHWNNFYVFDVMINNLYVEYGIYKIMLEAFGIDYIPAICKIKNPSYEKLIELLDKNIYLIKDGQGTGEGIVVKNYEYRNKYGRITWAKIVKNEFKIKHQKVNNVLEIQETKIIEEEIVKKYVTKSLIEKEFAKIENESGWSSKKIPQLLSIVYYCLIKEEMWNILKEFKNPNIDFKRLNFFVINKVKETMNHLF
jgi:hypothetical protein